MFGAGWSRRRFLAVSSATAAEATARLKGLGQAVPAPAASAPRAGTQEAATAIPAKGVITGGTRPLMKGMTARPLRYTPVNGEFVIRNGTEFFNRPIYGPPEAGGFRVDAGDLPEFSLYLPGHGGNLKLGVANTAAGVSKWAAQADEIVARYRPGRMVYEIRDALLGKGTLRAELLTAGEGSGLLLKVEGHDLPEGTRLAWAFGGVSGRKGRRGGDIGCEVQPVSQFFQVRPEECDGNRYTISDPDGNTPGVVLVSKAANLTLWFPKGSKLSTEDFDSWSKAPGSPASREIKLPILTGSVEIGTSSFYLGVARVPTSTNPEDDLLGRIQTLQITSNPSVAFNARSMQVEAIAQSIKIDTPDEYINAAGPALAIAADALWDAKQGCLMHGAVAWRQAFAGWRGPYALDALGTHDRAVANFHHWLGRQNQSPIATTDPATGPWDPNMHMTRKERLLHSNGDVENSHYDMNLVLFDALLRHLMWTGDLDFAREIWPALQRHLAWEHRLFRRTYTSASGKQLPLYEAYAAIWASDNLQYNGGGAAHTSAYNLFALRFAAKLARALGEDGSAYASEADLLQQGMHELLWVPAQGLMAESKDLLGPQITYTNPALWTVYHTIDSEVPTPREAWQMAAERLAALPHIPIHGEGVPTDGCYMLSCSDWLPYMWSLNLLLLAENAHMALALWQAGMPEEAFRIFKGTLLDSMFMGLCPGDFHMTSALDVHRQEAQRDFGDPIGASSRALVEGLFGLQPNLLEGKVHIRPGFPAAWNHASLHHKDFDFLWKRIGQTETYEFTGRFAKPVQLGLSLAARTTSLPAVTSNGRRVSCAFDKEAIGAPRLTILLPAASSHSIQIAWHGNAPTSAPTQRTYRMGEPINLPRNLSDAQINDPQGALKDGRVTAAGFHTIFASMHEGDCTWSMPISFFVEPVAEFAAVPHLPQQVPREQLNLSAILKDCIGEIFTRLYPEPRSPYCSLALPDNLLGGWANPDGRATIDDAGLRAAAGLLKTAVGVDFATPTGSAPNCAFISYWKPDPTSLSVPLTGRARGIYLLMAGTTTPQCGRMQHGTVSVTYSDGASATLPLRNPETWWPIEQDYLLDDYLFVNTAPLPPRVDLRTGNTRLLDPATFRGTGRNVPGGAATILHLALDPSKELASLRVQADLYGVVLALLAATLARA